MNSNSLCVIITGPSIEEAQQQILEALQCAQIVEWRLDLFHSIDFEVLKALRDFCTLPIIITLRPKRQGGKYPGDEQERLHLIQQLLTLIPEYIDLEYDLPESFVHHIKNISPNTKILISYHNFEETPKDLEKLFAEISRHPADLYKIATMAHSTLDALRMLALCQAHPRLLIGLCMGEPGQISRILAPVFGAPLSYTVTNSRQVVVPGQLSADTLLNTYRFKDLSSKTRLFGLIGSPVSHSMSHITHNAVMRHFDLDGVYVKMEIQEEELEEFMTLAKRLNFQGLSVTMPLKEAIMTRLDEVDPHAAAIGAVNTIHFVQGRSVGHNTDAGGALNALEQVVGSVMDKKIIILGAGGAARAVAYAMIKRGAVVTILNRNADRAHTLARSLKCGSGGIDLISQIHDYSIVVNATKRDVMPVDAEALRSQVVAMDINNTHTLSPFLQAATIKGCTTISGFPMFIEQAILQFMLWFGRALNGQKIKQVMIKAATIPAER